MRLRLLALVAALAALLVAVGFRLRELDAGSTVTQSSSFLGANPRELVRATRPSGTEVVVEVCSTLLGDAEGLRTVRFSLVDLATGRRVLETTVDPEVVRHGPTYSCARLTSAAPGRGASRVALLGESPTPVRAMVAGRVVTRRPVGGLDLVLVAALAIVGLALLGALVRSPAAAVDDAETPPMDATTLAIGTLALGVAAFVGIARLPVPGTMGGLVRGALLLASQLALIAFALPRDARASFGFVRPARPALYLGLAPFAALLVRVVAIASNAVLPAARPSAVARLAVPSAGTSHAETILDPRSGILAIAAIAVVAPVVEELFFRGVLYGALARAKGPKVAFVGTTLAFVLAHVPQTLGDPSALVSIATLSILATSLRATSGSVVPGAIMHLVHNGMLVLVGLIASR